MLAEVRTGLADSEFADVRPTHGCVFRFVRADGLRLTELASLAAMAKQSVGEIVDDLVERGYVERVPDPADRRAKLIRLTDRGREAQAFGFGAFAEIEKRWIERYGRDHIEELREILEAIATAEAPQTVPELRRPELADV